MSFSSALRHELPLDRWGILLAIVLGVTAVGLFLDERFHTLPDQAIHDAALVSHPRSDWQHAAIVGLDAGVALEVGRKQLLPLYAAATERAVEAGAEAVFLDARLVLEMEKRMPYAACIDQQNGVVWSSPQCRAQDEQCQLTSSPLALRGPFHLSTRALPHFLLAPPLTEKHPPPLWLLFGPAAMRDLGEDAIGRVDIYSVEGGADDGVRRWTVLDESFAAVALAARVDAAATEAALQIEADDLPCEGAWCRRVRFSEPMLRLDDDQFPILALSRLADCDHDSARNYARQLENRAVILQLTALDESSDQHITPMTVAWGSPRMLSSGPQLLADSMETLLRGDQPRRPAALLRYLAILIATLCGVLAGAQLRNQFALLVPVVVFALMTLLCFIDAAHPLWPVGVTSLSSLLGVAGAIGVHLMLGAKRGALVARYLPPPVRKLLLSQKGHRAFINQHRYAVILMSDLAGYTTITSRLEDPAAVINLLNDYLKDTTITLQERFGGWLECYVADMVCFYWPSEDTEPDAGQVRATLQAAEELQRLQHDYFSTLSERHISAIDSETLAQVSQGITAGIGIAAGIVVMGNVGPDNGIQKFGVLGDCVNLASRVEGLTRHFNTEIIVCDDLERTARKMGFGVRRLARVKVKGRTEASELYAIGSAEDPRFEAGAVARWEAWLDELQSGKKPESEPDPIFSQDTETLLSWWEQGYLTEAGIWELKHK